MIEDPIPYTQILPKCGHSYILDFQKKADELLYRSEISSVVREMRDVDVFHLFGNNYDNQIDILLENGLIFLPIRRIKTYVGFNHKHYDTNILDKDSMVFGVVAKSLDVANKFKELESRGDHIKMGEMLGYPECCSRAFSEYFKRSTDPVYDIALNTNHTLVGENFISIKDVFWETYVHMRYFGFRIIPWLPCSFECEESKELSKDWISLMRSLDEHNLVDELINIMKTPSTWSLYNAQVVVNKPPHLESKFFGYATSCYLPGKFDICFH